MVAYVLVLLHIARTKERTMRSTKNDRTKRIQYPIGHYSQRRIKPARNVVKNDFRVRAGHRSVSNVTKIERIFREL